MLKFLADEDVPRSFSSQLRLHLPGIDIVRVVDVGLGQTPDPVILQWAADNGRVVITRDAETMTKFARERIRMELPCPGVIVVRQAVPIGPALRQIIRYATERTVEIDGQVVFISAPRRTLL